MSYELRVQRTLAGSPALVWQALTDPEALCTWFWPRAKFGTTARVDLMAGGHFEIRAPLVGIGVSGQYVTVQPPWHLAMTWRWDGDDDETLVTISLAQAGGGTRLTLVHSRFADDSSRDQNAQGWSDCLDRLPGWLAAQTVVEL